MATPPSKLAVEEEGEEGSFVDSPSVRVETTDGRDRAASAAVPGVAATLEGPVP